MHFEIANSILLLL